MFLKHALALNTISQKPHRAMSLPKVNTF